MEPLRPEMRRGHRDRRRYGASLCDGYQATFHRGESPWQHRCTGVAVERALGQKLLRRGRQPHIGPRGFHGPGPWPDSGELLPAVRAVVGPARPLFACELVRRPKPSDGANGPSPPLHAPTRMRARRRRRGVPPGPSRGSRFGDSKMRGGAQGRRSGTPRVGPAGRDYGHLSDVSAPERRGGP